MRSAVLPLLAVFAGFTVAHAASPNMRDGLWEITTKMEMTGKSGMQMPTQTARQCLTKKDVEDPRRATPGAGDQSRCKMADHKMQGNTATWRVECQDGTTSIGTVTYRGDSYEGNQTIAMKRSGQAMNMKMEYSGRRVGDCPKK